MTVNSAGKLVDGAGKEFSVRPDGVLTGPGGVVVGATGVVITAAGMSENAALSYGDGAVMANGKNLATGAKILVKKQVSLFSYSKSSFAYCRAGVEGNSKH